MGQTVSKLMSSARTVIHQHGTCWVEESKVNQIQRTWCSLVPPFPKKAPTDPCPSDTCPHISQFICFTYDPDTFQTVTSVLGLRVKKFVHGPLTNSDLVSQSPMTLTDVSFASLQKQMLCRLLFLMLVPRVGKPDVGLRSFTLKRENCLSCNIPPMECCIESVGPNQNIIFDSPAPLNVSFSLYPQL